MDKLTNNRLSEQLQARFAERIKNTSEPYGLYTIEVTKEDILEVLEYLKTDPQLQFNYLTDITAVHYPEQALSIAVVYHLHSLVNNLRIRIKVYIDGNYPAIPTATVLWNGANWMERETYDFFGVQFIGHPDLRRILNVDDMEAFPMRKEFPLEDPNRVDKKDYFFGR
ncbi:NADH dehydrogenase subunit C [bacterium A37T11]|nr:NADH dehydrogenase subunit C [bacterium A37T11]